MTRGRRRGATRRQRWKRWTTTAGALTGTGRCASGRHAGPAVLVAAALVRRRAIVLNGCVVFCDVSLAQRIERAEQRLLASSAATMRARVPDLFATEIGGGFASFTEPGSPLNKVVGLGFAPFDDGAWAAVEAEHARRGAPVQVEVSTLADPAVAQRLTGRGYALIGVENVLGRVLASPLAPGPRGPVTVETCPATALDAWLDVMVSGFAVPDTQGVASHESYDRGVIARVIRDFAAADGVGLFLARHDGVLAGAGAMRLDGGIAQLCGASTLPAQRRRGVQAALLAHRLAFAAARGCDLAVVTTQPGSTSQQNVMRQGFALLYSRNVLRREPA